MLYLEEWLPPRRRKKEREKAVSAVDSKVWFNTPRLAAAQRPQRLQKFGIKPDGIINFLSNEPPFKQKRSLRYRRACPAEAHLPLRQKRRPKENPNSFPPFSFLVRRRCSLFSGKRKITVKYRRPAPGTPCQMVQYNGGRVLAARIRKCATFPEPANCAGVTAWECSPATLRSATE
jgi:hypothetical protein